MHVTRQWLAVLAAVALTSATAAGCGDDSGTSSSRNNATSSSSSSSSSGGEGGAGGAGGAGGQGGAADNGAPATETVTAGEVSKSPNYKMVFTFGQPTQNQGTTTSPGYRMQGGLVGATGSAK